MPIWLLRKSVKRLQKKQQQQQSHTTNPYECECKRSRVCVYVNDNNKQIKRRKN